MCPICQLGSTAPLRTMWRRRGGSRVDTSSACLPPSGMSSRSRGTKVGTGRAKGGEVIWVVMSLGGGVVTGNFGNTCTEFSHDFFFLNCCFFFP